MVERKGRLDEHAAALGCEALGKLARDVVRGEASDEAHLGARARFVSALDAAAPTPKSVALRGWLALLQAAAVTLLLCAGVAALWSLRAKRAIAYEIEGQTEPNGTYVRAAETEVRVVFSEGSVIRLEPGSSAQVAETTADGARIVAHQGKLRARITKLPHTSWAIEAGPYAVRVTGTDFTVDWDASQGRLVVDLYEGSVVVSGPQVPSGVPLSAGHRLVGRADGEALAVTDLRASDASLPSSVPSASGSAENAADAAVGPAKGFVPTETEQLPSGWRERVAVGQFAEVVGEAEAEGIDSVLTGRSLEDLLALGDAARYAKRADLAEKVLLAERARFPTSAQSTTAAFLLGRLAEARGAAGEAMQWYSRYRLEAPSGALAEEALGRLMVLLQQTGQSDAARSAAQQYLASYPSGAFAKAAKTLLGEP